MPLLLALTSIASCHRFVDDILDITVYIAVCFGFAISSKARRGIRAYCCLTVQSWRSVGCWHIDERDGKLTTVAPAAAHLLLVGRRSKAASSKKSQKVKNMENGVSRLFLRD